MKTEKPEQAELEFDFYDDLDVIQDGRIGIDFEGNLDYIILDVNGTEIKITDDETLEAIYQAIKIRVENRRERQIKELRQEAGDSLASQESNNLI